MSRTSSRSVFDLNQEKCDIEKTHVAVCFVPGRNFVRSYRQDRCVRCGGRRVLCGCHLDAAVGCPDCTVACRDRGALAAWVSRRQAVVVCVGALRRRHSRGRRPDSGGGGGVDLTLHLVSRTLTVNKVAKRFVSTDAPGEFQRLRSGRFEWPFRALAVEPQPEPNSGSFGAVSGASAARWTGERSTSASDTGETTTLTGEREIDVYWKHPGQGDRLLFSVAGPGEKYEAIDRAFSTFAAWIDQEDEARRVIERRHQAEAWQRDWEAKRLAEELDHTRSRGESAFDETDPHLRVAAKAAKAIMPLSRW